MDLDNGSVCDNAFDFHPLPISPDLYEDSNCPRTILRGCITSCTGSINIDGGNSQILRNCFAGGSSNHIDSNENKVLNSLHTTKSSEERENIRSDEDNQEKYQMDKATGHRNGVGRMKYILRRGLMVENDICTSLFCPNCPMFVVCGHEYVFF